MDNRFPEPGVDARFSTPGEDWRFKDFPVDNRFPEPGVDRRWEGPPWGQSAPVVVTPATVTPTSGAAGTNFTVNVGTASGEPAPTSTVVVRLNGTVLAPTGGVYRPMTPGTLTVQVTWSNGVDPDLVQNLTATVTAVAPTVTTAPTLTPATGEIGTAFTLTNGAATGIPAPTATVAVTLNGSPVTGTGGVYTPTAAGTLSATVTWSNGATPNAVRTVTATVTEPPPPDPEPEA